MWYKKQEPVKPFFLPEEMEELHNSSYLNTINTHKKKWLLLAPIGLVLVGAGLSMAIDAGSVKANSGNWFWYGTAALIIFNSGLCIFGTAIIEKVKSLK